MTRLDRVQGRLKPLRVALLEHPIYQEIDGLGALRSDGRSGPRGRDRSDRPARARAGGEELAATSSQQESRAE